MMTDAAMTTIKLSPADIDHIIGCLQSQENNGEYWGNKAQFHDRHNKLYDMLVEAHRQSAKRQ